MTSVGPPTPVFVSEPAAEAEKQPSFDGQPPKPPGFDAQRPSRRPEPDTTQIVANAEYRASHPAVVMPQPVFTFGIGQRLGEPAPRATVKLAAAGEVTGEVTNEIKDEVFLEADDTLMPSTLGTIALQSGDPFGIADALRALVPEEPPIASEPEVALLPPSLPGTSETKCYALFQEFLGRL
jgi:hypothetical protein